jgi:Protein of unknown function (DUF3305)
MTSPADSNLPSRFLDKVGPLPTFVSFKREKSGAWRLRDVQPEEPEKREKPNPAGDPNLNSTINCVTTPIDLWIYRDEAEGYYLNLESPEPSFFVKWRVMPDTGAALAIAISLSYDEAGRWLDASENVDRIALPAEMLPWLAEFTQAHYQPEGKKKKRGPKPSFMSREEYAGMASRESTGTAVAAVPHKDAT